MAQSFISEIGDRLGYDGVANTNGEHVKTISAEYFKKIDNGVVTNVRIQDAIASIESGKVVATDQSSVNSEFKLLATASASPTSGAMTEAVYDTGITMNPSTNTLTANLAGTAASASALDMNATVPIQAGTGVSIASSETAVTVALSEAVQTSLGKADSALQNVKVHGETLTKTDNGVNLTNSKIFQYGECSTAAATAAKTVTVNGTFTLAAGAVIFVKFANSNTATGATLNVNSTGAKNIYRYGTTSPGIGISSTWQPGSVVALAYDGSAWQMIGWLNEYYTFDGTYNASTNKAATVSSITSRINALDATATSTDGTNVQVKVTETDGKVSAVNITKDDTEKAFTIDYRASDQALVFSKAFGTIT